MAVVQAFGAALPAAGPQEKWMQAEGMNRDELDPLLSRSQVCAAIGIKDTSLYKIVKLGLLAEARAIKGTRKVGWRHSDVKRYLDGLPPVKLRPLPKGAAAGHSSHGQIAKGQRSGGAA